jgi:anti-anti-sigma factor
MTRDLLANLALEYKVMVALRLEQTDHDPTAVRFAGDCVSLDEAATMAVREEVLALADGLREGDLTLDLSNVAFLHGTTLGVFLLLRRRLCADGRRFRLRNPQPQIADVLAVTRLSALFGLRGR